MTDQVPPCLNLNDGERLGASDMDRLISVHKRWGYDGVIAWASMVLQSEPAQPLRTEKYY